MLKATPPRSTWEDGGNNWKTRKSIGVTGCCLSNRAGSNPALPSKIQIVMFSARDPRVMICIQ